MFLRIFNNKKENSHKFKFLVQRPFENVKGDNDGRNKAQVLGKDVEGTNDNELAQDFMFASLGLCCDSKDLTLNYASIFISLFIYFKELVYRIFFPF